MHQRYSILLGLLLSPILANAATAPTADDFQCIRDMTPVRHFYVDNLRGPQALQQTLKVANAANGGRYPEGSVIQLVPTEAMVKREQGFSPVTNDWEFFDLNVSQQGTEIRTRGFADVNNRFGGNCFACHVKARPEWDLVCETTHGCDPIPLTHVMTTAIQKTDPRCSPVALTAEEKSALAQLTQQLK